MRWLITLAIVLALAAAALSAPWWLPALLAPFLGDPVLVESAMTLAQLILWVTAGLAAMIGIRWALKPRGSSYKVMDADELEAAVAQATTEDEAGSEPAKEQVEAAGAEGEVDAQTAAEGSEEAKPGNLLSESLFGPGGALPAEKLRPVGELEPEAQGQGLNEALFGPDGPLATGLAGVDGAAGQQAQPAAAPPDEAALVAAGGARIFSLLADLPDFFGRGAELAQVRRQLGCGPGQVRRPTLAISNVSGMAGVGKTSLVLRLAHALTEEGRFPDAQLYIDLKGTSPSPLAPATALSALLTTVMGTDQARPGDEDTLAHLWRGALQDKQVLLILDDAAGAAQVRPLLPGNPTCAVLITSQHRFALPGAGRLDLRPLGPQEARVLLQTLAPRLEDAEADEIARLCGGLPLALRIAGNHLALNDDLSPAAYIAELAEENRRLDLLHDDGEPGQDVAAWLAASANGLDQAMRRSWAQLAYMPAPFDVPAAAALWGEGEMRGAWQRLAEGEARDRLRLLRNRSLVTYDPEMGRYDQHVLLRLAARRELAANATTWKAPVEGHALSTGEGARRRLAYHFLEVARSADDGQRYMDLDRDWPHLRAALEWSGQTDVKLLSDLVQSLSNYWSARGMAGERARWNDVAARGLGAAGHQGAQGIHLGDLGAAYDQLGQPQQAIEAYGKAIIASRAIGDRDAEAAHLQGVGQAYQELGDVQQALLYYQQALDLCREIHNRTGEGEALGCLGSAYAAQGDARRAIGYLQEAMAVAREVGDRRVEGIWLGELAQVYAELGDAQQAVNTQELALAIARETGDRREEGAHLARLGQAYMLLNWNGAGEQGVAPELAITDEDQLTPIRQIIVPPPRGIEVFSPEPGRWVPEGMDVAHPGLADQAAADLGKALAGTPELTIQDIWANTTALQPGEWTTVSFRVRNLGTAAISNRFYVRMWFDTTVVHTWYIDHLLAGGSAVGSVMLRVADEGRHQITVHADLTDTVPEMSRSNNVRSEVWVWGDVPDEQVTQPEAGGEKDPLAGPLPDAREWGEEGHAFGIKQIVIPTRQGIDIKSTESPYTGEGGDSDSKEAAAPATGIAALVSGSPDPGTEISGIQQTIVPPPERPGEAVPKVPGSLQPKTRAADAADLTVLDIWSPTLPLVVGNWEMVVCRITNQGTAPVNKRFYTRMWFDNILIRTWYADSLVVGRTAIGSVWIRVANSGTHTIKVQVDVTNAVVETDESNNVRTETGVWQQEGSIQAPGQQAAPQPGEGLTAPGQQQLAPSSDGATGRARELWTQALIIFEEIGDPRSQEVRSWLAELDS